MRLLITGHKGMLGRTLCRRLADHDITGFDLPEHDLTDTAGVEAAIAGLKPDAVIHGAAFTRVDDCESEVDLAYAVNALGSANLARACHRHGARLLAIGTDYVFAGDQGPYSEYDQPDPRSVYGASKLAGEEAIRSHCPDHTIIRIAWLYGAGGPSFLHTMRKLGADSSAKALRVVDDQIGNPTSCDAVADLIAHLLEHPLPGVVHGSCEGECSWHGFTRAILDTFGLGRGLEPCTTDEFPRPAPRPADSRLDKRVLRIAGRPAMPHWQDTLARFAQEHPDG